MNLDEDQEKVVQVNNGYWKVIAGAGSGKSTCLLARTSRLITENPSAKILCVTFTSEAARSLRTRIQKVNPRIDTSVFSTLHALALKFAYAHPDAYPFRLAENPLADEGVSARYVFDAIGDTINFKAFTTYVSLKKRNRIDPNTAVIQAEKTGENLDYAIGYKRYQNLLRKNGVLDFDDLIYFFVDVLESRPDIRSIWQYDYILLDEAQDCSEIDWRLLQLLSQKHKNVMAVGDVGQSLFSFRGGISKNLLEMDKLFPGTQILYLGKNYRSAKDIVETGRKAYPYPDIASHFECIRSEVGVVGITIYSTPEREAEETVKKIQEIGSEDCAILARTNLALRPFEEALLDAGVNYHILGDSGFWESPEVKNVLYYIRCVANPTNNSVLGAIKAPFWPAKYVKKKVVIEKIRKYIDQGLTAWEALSHVPELSGFRNFLVGLFKYKYSNPEDAVKGIIQELKAVDYYKGEENVTPDRNPILNLKELAHAASRHGDLKTFLDFLRRVSYSNRSKKGICLSTVHQAKGKEWSNVFVVSVNEGILPHSKSEDIESERCVWFVAVSRAKDRLEISYSGSPSPFLKDLI